MRGRPSVFIGYPHGKKRYKIFDTHSIKITVLRDMKFVEKIIPSNPKKMIPKVAVKTRLMTTSFLIV